jgi:hypothetical protein
VVNLHSSEIKCSITAARINNGLQFCKDEFLAVLFAPDVCRPYGSLCYLALLFFGTMRTTSVHAYTFTDVMLVHFTSFSFAYSSSII